jgi:hypothetical protein
MPTSKPPESGAPVQPYEATTDDSFAEHAAAFDAEEADGDTIVLRGTCARCKHPMEYIMAGELVKRWRLRSAAATPEEGPRVEKMLCTCEADHPNRPAGYRGCGAFWDLEISAG